MECGVTETAALVEPPQSGSCAEAGVLEQFSHTKVEVRTLKCNRQKGGSNGLRIDVTGLYAIGQHSRHLSLSPTSQRFDSKLESWQKSERKILVHYRYRCNTWYYQKY